MQVVSIYQDLFNHNDWANRSIAELCEGLADDVLDAPRTMGFGSLRNTLFHILEAEKLWLERWQGQPWRPLQADAQGMTIQQISDQARDIAAQRNELLSREQATGFSRLVEFQDSQQNFSKFRLGSLLNHVSNHGIHHRAQALNLLRLSERQVAGGLDYLFWKLAYPSCEQPAESLEPIRQYGLQIANAEGHAPAFDPTVISEYFAYSDWATHQLLELAEPLADEQLVNEFSMGMGTLRKNLQHIIDAERWWIDNWTSDQAVFPRGEVPRSVTEMKELFVATASKRDEFVATLDAESAQRVVQVTAGGPVSRFRVVESMLQLCSHGTHHRAQCLNMFRQLEIPPPGIDLIVWLRGTATSNQDALS